MKHLLKIGMVVALCLCIGAQAIAQKTKIAGLYHYTLDNGLSLFIAENHMAPLVDITIAVRAGAVAQTPQTAGIFHLYEHMMFEGNEKYPTNIAIESAERRMGAIGENATTSIDLVNYYCTIPSACLRDGLEFYSYALRTPLLTEEALASQKKVVSAEIEGNFADSSTIYMYNLQRTLFPEAPWRLDAAGSSELVQSATVQDLRDMLAKYYVPNNAALFVGGDVEPQQVYELVKELYGDWQRAPNPYETPVVPLTKKPFTKIEYRVMPLDKISPDMASVSIFYRGPDGDTDSTDLYSANMFDELIANPDGTFVATFVDDPELGIPSSDYLGAGHVEMRSAGYFNIQCTLLNPQENLVKRVQRFVTTFRDTVIPHILSDKQYFTKEEFAQERQAIADYRILQKETASGLLEQVEHYWAITGKPDMYYTYLSKLKKVNKKDIDAYISTYIKDTYPLVVVSVNPTVYEQIKEDFDNSGFIPFTNESAYWWSK